MVIHPIVGGCIPIGFLGGGNSILFFNVHPYLGKMNPF